MNPSDPTIDQWIQEQRKEFVGPSLRMASVSKSRAAYLSDHRNVLRDLPNSGTGHWDLALATALHIGYADQYQEEVLPNLVSEGRTHVYRLTTETEQNRPNLVLTPDQRPSGGSLSNRGRTYIYCRIALAIMIERDQPRFAIQLYESIATLFPRITSHHIAIEPYWLAPGLPLRRLVGLYETVGRYEDALRLSIPYIVSCPYEPDRGYEAAIRRFNGWIGQVLNSGGIAEVKRLLDSIQTVMQRVSVNDQESREQLSDCLPETRQYWAWFYGYILGQMILQKPRRRESLLDELAANEWSEGWAASSMLVGTTSRSWKDYREWCLRLYHTSDLERKNNRVARLAKLPFVDWPVQHDPQWAMPSGLRRCTHPEWSGRIRHARQHS